MLSLVGADMADLMKKVPRKCSVEHTIKVRLMVFESCSSYSSASTQELVSHRVHATSLETVISDSFCVAQFEVHDCRRLLVYTQGRHPF